MTSSPSLLLSLETLVAQLTSRALWALHTVGACENALGGPFVNLGPAGLAWLVLEAALAFVSARLLDGANFALPAFGDGRFLDTRFGDGAMGRGNLWLGCSDFGDVMGVGGLDGVRARHVG